MSVRKIVTDHGRNFKLVPPDGGWGYVIAAALSLMLTITVQPLAVFGMVYGEFLAELGDGTGSTAFVNGYYTTAFCFTGLPAKYLLEKYSYRTVGLIGATLYFIGSFIMIFVNSILYMLISFGTCQAIGTGLLMAATFTAFNAYFQKKQTLAMGISRAIVEVIGTTWGFLTNSLMNNYGFRGTVAIFSALSLNAIVAMLVLQPVEWHLKKEQIEIELEGGVDDPLIEKGGETLKGKTTIYVGKDDEETVKKRKSLWQKISISLDLDLFKDAKYANIVLGISFAIASDSTFRSIYPLLLVNYGFNNSEVALMFTIFTASDVASRIFLCILSATYKLWNRYVFLFGAIFSAIFRTIFVANTTFWWVATFSGVLGFLRCFIQTPLTLVIAEEYGERFSTAFTLYMVVAGVVSLIIGILSGVIKDLTNSNVMVIHLLTLCYLLCAIPWTIEIVMEKFTKKKL